jgi:hypothetical protein
VIGAANVDWEQIVIALITFIVSTTVHEAAHALFAKLGGDLTAYRGGQVTLNPLPHIRREPFGMVLIPLITLYWSGNQSCFGYASTPIDPFWAIRHPRRAALMSAAGPLANLLLAAIAFISLLCWGPIPLACLWLGSEADYLCDSVSVGILVAFIGLFALLFGALSILRRLDNAWILVRRAAGFDQRTGVLGRGFAITALTVGVAFVVWFLVIQGPGSSTVSGGRSGL